MDAKITLSFDAAVITKAKAFAENNNVRLSRITEIFWDKMIDADCATLDALPVSDWVLDLIGGPPVYVSKNTKPKNYADYYESKYNATMVAEPESTYETKKSKKK
jgi:Family of unknown function (DUF6364)